MEMNSASGGPSALAGTPQDPPVPYAFERVQQDSEGGEVARLEAQNLLMETCRPLALLPPTPPAGRILDAGSGTGFWSLRLAARVPQGEIVCLDRSEDLLDLARRRLEGRCSAQADYLHQDLRRLDLPEQAFDLVFTCMTLAHVRELEAALGSLAAALKPGGWIACFEPMHQSRRFLDHHPHCPNLDFLMDRLTEVAAERGSDLSAALKIAHHLDRLGLADLGLRDFGVALQGQEASRCAREVFLPLARAYLRSRWEPELLERRLEAARQEAALPHLWLDYRRAVVLARRPG